MPHFGIENVPNLETVDAVDAFWQIFYWVNLLGPPYFFNLFSRLKTQVKN